MKLLVLSIRCILLLSFVLTGCSENQGLFDDEQVPVMVEIPVNQTTKANENDDLSILIFKEGREHSTFFRREKGGWISKEKNLEKKVLLPSGQYRFVLTKGSFYPDRDYDSFTEGTYLENCVFTLPVSDGKLVRECGEFFLDDDCSGQSPWSEVIDCSGNRPRTVERTLVRAVGRIDLLVCKAKKDSGGNIIPIDNTISDTGGKTFYELTLEKIKEIQVTVHNTTTKLCLDGFAFSDPAAYTYAIGKTPATGYEYLFRSFDSEDFGTSFVNDNSSQYKRFDGFPYQEGPFLFPTSGKSELEIAIRYNDFPEKKYSTNIKIMRNQVVFVIVYLLEEELQIELDTEIIESPLDMDLSLEDGGIWH